MTPLAILVAVFLLMFVVLAFWRLVLFGLLAATVAMFVLGMHDVMQFFRH